MGDGSLMVPFSTPAFSSCGVVCLDKLVCRKVYVWIGIHVSVYE